MLQRDTHIAAKTVGRAINAEIKLKEGDTVTQLSAYERKFIYAGADVEIISDRSDIWDQSSKDYTSLKVIEQLLHWLDGKAKEGGVTPTTIRDTLKALAVVNRYAVTWKRIINFASHSDALLSANYSLFLVPEILGGPETNYSAGKALEIAFAKNLYTPAENKVIEAAILDVPTSLKDVYKDATPLRNRLLGCIPESILGADSLKILHELKKTTGVPKNVPTFQIGPVTYGQPPEDDWLKRQGVEVDRPDNRVLLEAGKPLQSFASRFVNEAPSESDYSGVVEQLSRAAALIKSTLSADERIITDVLTSATGV